MSDKPELIKVDMGPYASQIYKFTLFDDGEHYMEDNKALKFLHFNIDRQRKMSKRMLAVWQSRTVAALALSPHAIRKISAEFLAQKAGEDIYVEMAVGVTFVSKNDNYSREIGRNEAVKKMVEINMKVVGLIVNETHVFVNLAPYKGVQLNLRLNKKSGFSTVTGLLTSKEET